jgi:hypothetical protein
MLARQQTTIPDTEAPPSITDQAKTAMTPRSDQPHYRTTPLQRGRLPQPANYRRGTSLAAGRLTRPISDQPLIPVRLT